MRFAHQLVFYKGEIRQDHKRKMTFYLHWATDADDCARILEWFVPLRGVSAQHEAMIEKVIQDAGKLGVDVRVYRVEE